MLKYDYERICSDIDFSRKFVLISKAVHILIQISSKSWKNMKLFAWYHTESIQINYMFNQMCKDLNRMKEVNIWSE